MFALPASVLLLAPAALGQGLEIHRPTVPSASLAAENGPGALWVNPANLGYDPDPRYGLFFSRAAHEHGPSSFALTAGTRGLSLGLHQLTSRRGGELRSDWSIDYGTSLQLPERLSVGLMMSWNLIDGADNYVTYDVGLSWRPIPWLGFAGVAQNVSSRDSLGIARPRTGAGFALRPFGSFLVLGLDYARLFAPDDRPHLTDEERLSGSVRLRPFEGLYLRGGLDAAVGPDGKLTPAWAGLGLEVYFEGVGGAYHYDFLVGSGVAGTRTAWLGTDEPGESLVRSGRRVPKLEIDAPPPYVPRVSLLSLDPGLSWLDVLELMRRVETERGTRGLVLTLEGTEMSWARWRELRQRVEALEARGKPVVVYLRGSPSNGAFYVASAASRVVLHPAADLNLIGVAASLSTARGTLDLLGVQPQFVKRERYKSAPETFTHKEPSEASLEQTHALVDALYEELVERIAEGRELPRERVEALVDRGPLTPAEALENGLVDELRYPDQLDALLARLHRGEVKVADLTRMPQPRSAWEEPSQIALIYIDGVIVPGKSSSGGLLGPRATGSRTVVEALERAGESPLVRAVVLRVDSPGGSAFASDEIWHAVSRLRAKGKPVVVSMGGVAASGGYYVAAGADAIWAQPNTVTGSIGVYSGKMVVKELLEGVGVNQTVVVRGRNADILSPSVPWTDEQRERMQVLVDDVYDRFLDRVARGREMSVDEVDAVAGGRVWSGRDALETGLVDQLGGLQDAIQDARRRASLPEGRKVGLVTYGPGGNPFESLAPSIMTRLLGPFAHPVARARADLLGEVAEDVGRLTALLEPLDEALLWTLYPTERVWLLDPDLAEVATP